MPQPKSSGGPSRSSRRPASRKPASKRAASKPKPKPKAAASKPAARRASKPKSKTAAKRRKPAAKRGGARPAAAASASTARAGEDALRSNLTSLRDLLTRGVVITGERIQEAVDDAVRRGRMMPQDAEELVANILSTGRQQTQDVLADIEQLLGRTRSGAEGARAGATAAGKKARDRGSEAQDKVLQRVDRARRAAGIGTFPVLNYDDLTASQIADRVTDLTPAELRKVRDYEKRNANRKSVLDAIGRRLS